MCLQWFQSYDNEGNVTSTHTIDHMGNTQSMPGGVSGAVPGAPADFNIANIKFMRDMGIGPKNANGGKGKPN